MAVLQNEIFTFINDVNTGSFNLSFSPQHKHCLQNNCMAISGQLESGEKFSTDLLFKHSHIPATHLSPDSLSLTFSGEINHIALRWVVEFAFSKDGKICKWRASIANASKKPIFMDRIDLLRAIDSKQENYWDEDLPSGEPFCFSNGWQSWSYTGAYQKGDRMRNSSLGFLQESMVLNTGTPKFRKENTFSSDMFTVVGDRSSGAGVVLGFLSQKEQYGSFFVKIDKHLSINAWANCDHVRLDPGCELHTDWFAVAKCDLQDSTSINTYMDAVTDEHEIKLSQKTPVGWCSWYYYYQDISEKKIAENIEKLHEIKETLPVDLIQIDDGYQSQVGDWLSFNANFPNGVSGLAKEIKAKGFIPGIWLAPFIVHPKSELAKNHPDWLLKKKNGKRARAGFVWNSLGLALDLTVPEALDYVRKVIRTAVKEWGFSYLKLDFLYAAVLDGKYSDETKTRAQVLQMGMQAVREAAGSETVLLGCGAPLGSMLGLVDIMRIGADISGHWAPDFFNISFPFKNEPCMPSARMPSNPSLWDVD